MKAALTLALKDLKILTRDWFGLFWILVFPLMYALFFGAVFSGATGSGGNRSISVAVVDEVGSTASRQFIDRLKQSKALRVEAIPLDQAQEEVRTGKRVAYLVLKGGFGGEGVFWSPEPKRLELGIDPARRADAEMLKGLIMETVFVDFKEVFADPSKARAQAENALKEIAKIPGLDDKERDVFKRFFGELETFLDQVPELNEAGAAAGSKAGGFNFVDLTVRDTVVQDQGPRSAFEIMFPSAVMWGIIGSITTFAISLVLERTQGTLLRLKIAPLTRAQLLAGKGLACFLTCVGVTVFLLTFASLFLSVRLGNLAYLAVGIACTAFCFTGLMMFISTLGKTEQGVAGAGWGLMMPLAMLGGGMIPLIAMPNWLLTASHVSPIKWGILALEGAIWRGFSLAEMLLPCAILLAVGAVAYGVGVWWLNRREI